MGDIDRKAYMIPLRYLEGFGDILDIKDMSAGEELKLKQKLILTKRVFLERTYEKKTEFSIICWMTSLGLEECLEPEVLRKLMAKTSHFRRYNVLLSGSLFGRLAIVRKLFCEGWKPDAIVLVEQGDDAGGDNTTWGTWSTVWLVVLD